MIPYESYEESYEDKRCLEVLLENLDSSKFDLEKWSIQLKEV